MVAGLVVDVVGDDDVGDVGEDDVGDDDDDDDDGIVDMLLVIKTIVAAAIAIILLLSTIIKQACRLHYLNLIAKSCFDKKLCSVGSA
jgi:hypothetical protein